MLKKYSILAGLTISILLLIIATLYYPGGSQYDKNAIGYSWKNNYLSNLFGDQAVNGAANGAQVWAISGMFFLCISFALFFIEFSNKIPSKGPANIIRYCGVSAMLFAFFAVTSYHDKVIPAAITLALISMFYITVFVFKSKLHLLKILSVICLLAFYGSNYVYFTRSFLEILPVLQKAVLVITITWIICLQYFTSINNFQPINQSPAAQPKAD